MKRVLEGQKNIEYCVNQKLKELAEKNGLTEYKSKSLIELEVLLTKNLKGFSLRKNFLNKSMTVAWFEGGRLAEITYSVDPTTGKIYEEDNH
jgi:CRISPR/Cas system type I-B associated protein Csh2 (Cas7 group RAMP superfamily)